MSKLIKNNEADTFFDNVARLIEQARRFVGRTADLTMCVTYFEVGRMIPRRVGAPFVEEEQGGAARAAYGRRLMRELADFLTEKFGRGFSLSTLKNARKFYTIYTPSTTPAPLIEKSQALLGFFESNLRNARKFYLTYASSIQQFATVELGANSPKRIRQTASDELENSDEIENRLIDILAPKDNPQIQQAMLAEFYPFRVRVEEFEEAHGGG